MIKKIFLSFAAITAATTGIAHANWEERPVYIDDGMRMTITVRGGAAYGFGNAKNQLGTLMPTTQFYSDGTFLYPDDPTCGGAGTATCQPLGQIDIAKIPTAKNFSGFSWDSNVAIGFTVPHAPQIRLEANWEHIGRTHYNATPLFNGDVKTTGGATI
ncbi:MAG: hypothetical protein FWC51_04485, partial [Proteobacteria bacterium]|nr:hypothetical protein [Pseudomonadota bacterium]